jgi:hypothetical protein
MLISHPLEKCHKNSHKKLKAKLFQQIQIQHKILRFFIALFANTDEMDQKRKNTFYKCVLEFN